MPIDLVDKPCLEWWFENYILKGKHWLCCIKQSKGLQITLTDVESATENNARLIRMQGDTRYSTRRRRSSRKSTSYTVLRFLPMADLPHLSDWARQPYELGCTSKPNE